MKIKKSELQNIIRECYNEVIEESYDPMPAIQRNITDLSEIMDSMHKDIHYAGDNTELPLEKLKKEMSNAVGVVGFIKDFLVQVSHIKK